MSGQKRTPIFDLLGYNIQVINFSRIENEVVEQIRITIKSSNYDSGNMTYSLVLSLKIDFQNSKDNYIEMLGGFKINDVSILENENQIVSIFSASLYPFMRSLVINLTSDSRAPLVLPTVDLRMIDLAHGVSLEFENKQ